MINYLAKILELLGLFFVWVSESTIQQISPSGLSGRDSSATGNSPGVLVCVRLRESAVKISFRQRCLNSSTALLSFSPLFQIPFNSLYNPAFKILISLPPKFIFNLGCINGITPIMSWTIFYKGYKFLITFKC